ncbi:MAG: multidrug effflux MFS transporter [Proteobacteria bacterium]|nr:multidrug effflux MFS transporter [Pseudomonadota bacterium]
MDARLIVLLSAIGAFLPLATDGFLPAMRPMMAELGAGVGSAQLAISVTLAGFAIAQLVVGVIADRYGRRPVLIAATWMFAAASAGAGLAPSLGVLLACRFLQGASAAAGPVVMRAVVRDLCSRVEGARILSYVGMGMGAVPLLVPAINAQVAIRGGWRATLAVCVLYLVVTALMAQAWFRETLAAPDRDALTPRRMAASTAAVLRDRRTLGYIGCCMFGYAGLAVWISSAPHLLMGYFREPPGRFGVWWAVPVITYVLGGYLSARGTRRHSSEVLLRTGCAVLLAAGVGLAILASRPGTPLAGFVLAVGAYNVGWAMVQPHAQAGALAHFPDMAGRVSAVLGFLQMLGGACIGLAFGFLHDGTPRAAALLIASAALGANAMRLLVAMEARPRSQGPAA